MFALDTNTVITKRRSRLDTLLALVSVLPSDLKAARRSLEVGSLLRRSGKSIGPIDNLIAGTALASDATLVTHNTDEFCRVRGLNLVDWC